MWMLPSIRSLIVLVCVNAYGDRSIWTTTNPIHARQTLMNNEQIQYVSNPTPLRPRMISLSLKIRWSSVQNLFSTEQSRSRYYDRLERNLKPLTYPVDERIEDNIPTRIIAEGCSTLLYSNAPVLHSIVAGVLTVLQQLFGVFRYSILRYYSCHSISDNLCYGTLPFAIVLVL